MSRRRNRAVIAHRKQHRSVPPTSKSSQLVGVSYYSWRCRARASSRTRLSVAPGAAYPWHRPTEREFLTRMCKYMDEFEDSSISTTRDSSVSASRDSCISTTRDSSVSASRDLHFNGTGISRSFRNKIIPLHHSYGGGVRGGGLCTTFNLLESKIIR